MGEVTTKSTNIDPLRTMMIPKYCIQENTRSILFSSAMSVGEFKTGQIFLYIIYLNNISSHNFRQGQVCMCERAKITREKNNPVYTVLPVPMNPSSL